MKEKPVNSIAGRKTSRRDFFKSSAAAVALPSLAAESTAADAAGGGAQNQSKPNLLLIIADQFRWDFVSAYGLNPMGITPNLDSIAQRGVAFRNAVTNQPLCCPSRSSLFTGQYPSQTGVWKNGFGLRPDANTIAKALKAEGYTTNYVGKWHLAPTTGLPTPFNGFVPLEYRGGFDDLWLASNELELTSHPYEGTIWDRD
ncbi:MAG TPA: sulfatase-like hydrolase/transferase, partial [Candidatus Acidoferrales bacterium]